MRREFDGRRLLNKLLDSWERRGEGSRRISSRPPLEFGSAHQRDALYEALRSAEATGCVALEMDRDAAHLISRVTLRDPAALYRHLERRPSSETRQEAVARLADFPLETREAKKIARFIGLRWQDGRAAAGLSADSVQETLRLLLAADAAFTALPGGVPLRTRSTRLLGDSKALERALPKLLTLLEQSGALDPGVSREDVLKRYGLEKYPQPVLMAGPLFVQGVRLPDWPYLGLPPEALSSIAAPGAASLLTIENLESFNRHVREKRRPDEVVIYLAGFPSVTILDAVRRIVASAALQEVWHWGDIDPGGIAIARYLETNIAVPLRLHLMSPEIARGHGEPAEAAATRISVPPDSVTATLIAYLEAQEPHWLEQEQLDPELVPRPAPTRL